MVNTIREPNIDGRLITFKTKDIVLFGEAPTSSGAHYWIKLSSGESLNPSSIDYFRIKEEWENENP